MAGSHGDRTPVTASHYHNQQEGRGKGGSGATRPGANGAVPSPSSLEGLSITESAFLERSRRVGLGGNDASMTGGDSLLGDHFLSGFQNGCSGTGRDDDGDDGSFGGGSDRNGNGGGSIATISALRDRLAVLDGENTALRARAHRAEEERATEAERGDKAIKKLTKVRLCDDALTPFVKCPDNEGERIRSKLFSH